MGSDPLPHAGDGQHRAEDPPTVLAEDGFGVELDPVHREMPVGDALDDAVRALRTNMKRARKAGRVEAE